MEFTPFDEGEAALWAIEAFGPEIGFERSATKRRTIYRGDSRARAEQACMEALALAHAFPEGRPGGPAGAYHGLVEPLFLNAQRAERAPLVDEPFSWALERHAAPAFLGSAWPEIQGVEAFWIDEAGASHPAAAILDARERAALDAGPAAAAGPFPIHEVAARIAALESGPAREPRPSPRPV